MEIEKRDLSYHLYEASPLAILEVPKGTRQLQFLHSIFEFALDDSHQN